MEDAKAMFEGVKVRERSPLLLVFVVLTTWIWLAIIFIGILRVFLSLLGVFEKLRRFFEKLGGLSTGSFAYSFDLSARESSIVMFNLSL